MASKRGQNMITVVAKNTIITEKYDEIIVLCKELVEETRKEDGCIKYEMHQDVNDKAILTMIEEWESQEALDKHMQSEHFTRIVPLLGSLMAAETDMNVYAQLI